MAISCVSLQLKLNTAKCYMKKDITVLCPKGEWNPFRVRPCPVLPKCVYKSDYETTTALNN